MDGIINIYKEKGYTSHDVVAKMRGILKQKKIGHTGTLDPDAIGVLPVCLGKATKVCELLTNKDKTYRAVVKLGIVTDTQDTSGTIIDQKPVSISEEELAQVISGFLGEVGQIPPMYSALKVGGKKLYELARKGIEVERQERQIRIDQIDLLKTNLLENEFEIRVRCSKGTYIRTLCHDIGQKLGTGAAMKELIREEVGTFSISDAYTLAEVAEAVKKNEISQMILQIDGVFSMYPACVVKEDALRFLYNGNLLFENQLNCSEDFIEGQKYRIYNEDKEFVALYEYQNSEKTFRIVKMFR